MSKNNTGAITITKKWIFHGVIDLTRGVVWVGLALEWIGRGHFDMGQS